MQLENKFSTKFELCYTFIHHQLSILQRQASDNAIDKYFEVSKPKEGCQSNNNNNGDQTSIQQPAETMDYHNMLNDDDGDEFMLDLDY